MANATAPPKPGNVNEDRLPSSAGYGRSEMDPGRDAWRLLERLWLNDGPGRIVVPVDPIQLCRGIGIVPLLDDELDAEVSVVLRKGPGFRDPEILLNPGDTRERRRFACAHAIGHYSHKVEMRDEGAWNVVDGRDLFGSENDPDESYATDFGAELLMPEVVLGKLRDTSVLSLATLFGVTGDVMGARLDQIGRRR